MATDATYILTGGADSKMSVAQKAKLARQVSIKKDLKILSVLFAQKREDWEDGFIQKKLFLQSVFGSTSQVELALPDTFTVQARRADIIYLHGGDTTLLGHYLDTIDNLAEIFAGKTVIGSSAGAEYISAAYFSPDWREIKLGRGLVSAKVLVHYKSEYGIDDPRGPINWQEEKHQLEQIRPNIPTYALEEGELISFPAVKKHTEGRT